MHIRGASRLRVLRGNKKEGKTKRPANEKRQQAVFNCNENFSLQPQLDNVFCRLPAIGLNQVEFYTLTLVQCSKSSALYS